MSALTVDHSTASGHEWDDVVRIWQETDAPEGCKVEIIEGIVTVAPPPSNAHNDIADLVQRELYQVIPRDWGIYQTLGTAVPSRGGLYMPDLAVAPREVLRAEKRNYIPAAAAELVVEITSKSNASNDRIKKAAGYAQAGVPLYLLIDNWAPGGPTITLYGEPHGDVYRVLRAGKFGDEFLLPEPFSLKLDTSEFPVG
ncbi:putative restriction endonuclease [Streptomyces puniciscabiei]|uniref:Putative restriction endonuclease n=1 Tax=Streptomyces puniciscabiei TaxID=164348 RepID=A0A542UD14_9ACTN|nr:Uma2 family endonuclease [Streptomyces puniciscabiei]TQK96951.1 putative restriction endonuclease [Streptomyces puniciscabiei]